MSGETTDSDAAPGTAGEVPLQNADAAGSATQWIMTALRDEAIACLHLDSDGCIAAAAGDVEPLLGPDPARWRGTPFHELASRATRARTRRAIGRLLRGEVPEVVTEDGALGPLSPAAWRATARPDGTVVVTCCTGCHTLPERHPLTRLADALPARIAYLDRNLRFRFNNRAYEDFFNLPRTAFQGRHVSEFLSEQAFETVLPRYRQVLAGEHVAWADRIEFRDGRVADLQIDYVPDVAPDGRVRGFYSAVQDVTEYVTTINLLKAVHRIVNQAEEPSAQTLRHLLDLGRGHLGLPTATVARVDGDHYWIDTCIHEGEGPEAGATLALEETCCGLTVAAGDLVAIQATDSDPRTAGRACNQGFPVGTYIGVPLAVDGRTWGTVSFSGTEPRTEAFTALDQQLLRLVADGVEHLIRDRVRRERERRERRRLEDLATTDALTGLPNRKAIDSRLGALASATRMHALALVDLDHFKAINDTHGHEAGDRVLQAAARRMETAVRNSDTVARYGGEEFLVIMPDTNLAEAQPVLERLRQAMAAEPIPLADGRGVDLTLSVGVTESVPEDAPGDAFRRADRALYRAKHEGRNRVETASMFPPAPSNG